MIVAENSELSPSYTAAVDRSLAPPATGHKPSPKHLPRAGIAGSIVGAAIALAPTANAGGDDDFLALLAQAGVPAHDNIPSVIAYGHQVCEALEGGEPASQVVDTMATYSYNEDPSHDLGQYHRTMVRFVRVAVTAFCPGAGGNLTSASRSSGVRVVLAGVTVPNPPLVPPQPDVVLKMPAPAVATPVPAPKQAPPPMKVPPPPPAVVEPPAVGPQPGVGNGGSDGSGGGHSGSDNGDGVPGPPGPKLPEGHIVLAP